jgi:hypothetical protein
MNIAAALFLTLAAFVAHAQAHAQTVIVTGGAGQR